MTPSNARLMTDSAVIRIRTTDDLPACVETLTRVYDTDRYPVQGVEGAQDFLGDPHIDPAWVAVKGGSVVGHIAIGKATGDDPSVALWWEKHPGAPIAVLERLFVDPDHRGVGLAARLIETAVSWSRGAGLRLVLFALVKDVGAARLYARLGWEFFGSSCYRYGAGLEMEALCYVSPASSCDETILHGHGCA
jgi:GNAT superfamily N-acetyltransferase